jgi:hypothetical protein
MGLDMWVVGIPLSSRLSWIGTTRTKRASQGYMDTLEKHKGWYDTHISVLHLLHTYLFIMLHFVLQKARTGVQPHYLNVWVPMYWMMTHRLKSL